MKLEFEKNNNIILVPKIIDYNQFDQAFTAIYSLKQPVYLTFDLTQMDVIPNVGQLIGMKAILDKHRPSTKKYLVESTVLLESKLLKQTFKLALPLLKPEKPVHII